MKTKFLVASLALACSAVTGNAFAADGMITVTGEVNANTCAIETVGASTGANPLVVLAPVAASSLSAPASYSAAKAFTLKINSGAGCVLSSVKGLSFIPADTRVTAAGNMKNLGDAAKVQVQLLDADNAVVNLRGGVAKMDATGNVAMAARYYSEEGGATTGLVKGEVEFTVAYN